MATESISTEEALAFVRSIPADATPNEVAEMIAAHREMVVHRAALNAVRALVVDEDLDEATVSQVRAYLAGLRAVSDKEEGTDV